jgi:hypothetical protein
VSQIDITKVKALLKGDVTRANASQIEAAYRETGLRTPLGGQPGGSEQRRVLANLLAGKPLGYGLDPRPKVPTPPPAPTPVKPEPQAPVGVTSPTPQPKPAPSSPPSRPAVANPRGDATKVDPDMAEALAKARHANLRLTNKAGALADEWTVRVGVALKLQELGLVTVENAVRGKTRRGGVRKRLFGGVIVQQKGHELVRWMVITELGRQTVDRSGGQLTLRQAVANAKEEAVIPVPTSEGAYQKMTTSGWQKLCKQLKLAQAKGEGRNAFIDRVWQACVEYHRTRQAPPKVTVRTAAEPLNRVVPCDGEAHTPEPQPLRRVADTETLHTVHKPLLAYSPGLHRRAPAPHVVASTPRYPELEPAPKVVSVPTPFTWQAQETLHTVHEPKCKGRLRVRLACGELVDASPAVVHKRLVKGMDETKRLAEITALCRSLDRVVTSEDLWVEYQDGRVRRATYADLRHWIRTR